MLTRDLHAHFSRFAASSKQTLHVIAPYIRVEALDTLLSDVKIRNVFVITTWRTEDVLKGASDPEIFPYLESKGWHLYLHPRLHAKVLVSDLQSAIVSSANITNPALGLSSSPNVECAVRVDSVSALDHLWVIKLIEESFLVQEDYYVAFKKHVESQRSTWSNKRPPEFDDEPFLVQRHFLTSSLPACDTPKVLIECLKKIKRGETDTIKQHELGSALHDIALYSLDVQLNETENFSRLKTNFFAHPFIKAYVAQISTRRFFGESKAWLQRNCVDVPAPSLRELTRPVRVLFDWLVELGGGDFVIERPRHSECIVRKNPASLS